MWRRRGCNLFEATGSRGGVFFEESVLGIIYV
jgi:hypothetical protein